ncbi:MAG: GGDEF domain-containing protein [Armatimonadota bacterium]|nr:GGDEF domain-containing protein [Armatimonadota bacterium]MDR7440128.1 GGDEF domain-containing protein [Armatimonadota bacterium]MDR7562603.1 GGDEF domain-containing protein [Armatimonadota bacterium]MDR7568097.1 GGDEF domain-containing protein [Armatimonadota bacterium]MDR7602479.1 GGDEF domain-containing protein [Armatimonadota bacterium]
MVRAADRAQILETWLGLVRRSSGRIRSEHALQGWGQALLEATEQFLYGRASAVEEAVLGLVKKAPVGSVAEPLELVLLFRRAALRTLGGLPPPLRESLEEAFDRAALVLAAWHDGSCTRPKPAPASRTPEPGAFDLLSFHLSLPLEIQRSLRYGRPLSLMLIELDAYDDLAALHGPEVADRAMEELVELLSRMLRATDTRYRVGAGRIAVLLPETGAEETLVAAERVREQVVRAAPFAVARDSYGLTVTAGIASCPEHAADAQTLLQRAEQALQAARRMGGNLALVYRP